MNVRVEHRYELVEIREEVVAEDEGMRGILHELDLRRLHHDLRYGLHLDLTRLHLELEQVGSVGIAQRNRISVVVQRNEQTLFGADDFFRGTNFQNHESF